VEGGERREERKQRKRGARPNINVSGGRIQNYDVQFKGKSLMASEHRGAEVHSLENNGEEEKMYKERGGGLRNRCFHRSRIKNGSGDSAKIV